MPMSPDQINHLRKFVAILSAKGVLVLPFPAGSQVAGVYFIFLSEFCVASPVCDL